MQEEKLFDNRLFPHEFLMENKLIDKSGLQFLQVKLPNSHRQIGILHINFLNILNILGLEKKNVKNQASESISIK